MPSLALTVWSRGSATPGIYWVVWQNAQRAFCHTTQYIRRAPQARARESAGKSGALV